MRHGTLVAAIILGILAGTAAAAPQVRLDYEGDVHGVKAYAAIVFEDLRLAEGSPGWWVAGDGSVLMVGSIEAGSTRYSFTAEILGNGGSSGYGDAVDLVTGDRFRVHIDFPQSIARFVLTANPFEGLYATSYVFDLTSSLPDGGGDGKDETDPADDSIGVDRAQLKVDFRRPSRDSIKMKLRLPDRYVTVGTTLRLDVGGMAQSFVLDADGRGRNAHGSVRVKRSGDGLSVKVKLKRGDWKAHWADDGLVDATVSGEPVAMPMTLAIGDREASTVLQLVYKAKAGKKGIAR